MIREVVLRKSDQLSCKLKPILNGIGASTNILEVCLPVHYCLLLGRGSCCFPVLSRGVPYDPERAGYGLGRVHQQHLW